MIRTTNPSTQDQVEGEELGGVGRDEGAQDGHDGFVEAEPFGAARPMIARPMLA
jgi:hypothetical protein